MTEKITPEQLGRMLWEAFGAPCDWCKSEVSYFCHNKVTDPESPCSMFWNLLEDLNKEQE